MMSLAKFATIHNPVPSLPSCSVSRLNEAASFWKGSEARILSVGNLKAVKNQALLIRAFARLASPNATLMILGEGALRPELERLATELGVGNRVILPGFQSDPTPFYETANLFVLSSDYEGFGNVIVEALATGTPVVSTDCPSGPSEILEGGKWGRLTPVGDVDALAMAMKTALAEEHDPEALKRRAADFSPAIAARKYLDALGLT